MSSKLLIIIATAEKEKALTGLMYAKNAVARKWLEDIKVIFFGPSENLVVEDPDISSEAIDIALSTDAIACKFLSDRDEISEKLDKMGIKVEYVGTIISELIKDGYVPMVW